MNLLRIKHENILALFYIPLEVINFTRTSADMFFIAIVMEAILFSGVYYGIKTTRKELIEEVKAGEYDDLIEDIKETLEPFRRIKQRLANVFNSIKKGSYTKQPKTTTLADAF